ncbi:hypothetical protein GCM10017581_054750 [Dactylosporangium matsuzakiense]|uniref:Uncharacterized protein n=1 Tax=Dactylosporangium matsuzakiense TaxID=53360 RepID=A0A9W6KQL4_9ACTN|nr:hypothetical protein GCM10017581_054750 [Dactylosporangium matsuzakiense]
MTGSPGMTGAAVLADAHWVTAATASPTAGRRSPVNHPRKPDPGPTSHAPPPGVPGGGARPAVPGQPFLPEEL